MRQNRYIYSLIVLLLLLNGCTSTFMGTIFVITFKDILIYIGLSFIITYIISLFATNSKKAFWIWIFLNLLLTPLIGFIYLLIKLSNRK
jgi:membrane glycosyltransferase